MIPLGTARPDADGGFRSPFTVRARGDLVVYLEGQTVTTLDAEGRKIAQAEVPWRAVNTMIDGTGQVWVQVLGGVSTGYNLMLLTDELDLIGQAIIPRFRDAYGDYVLTTRRDSLNAELLILSRRNY